MLIIDASPQLLTPAWLQPALWLDAADQSTITIATGVSEWRDKSGNGRNAIQLTASNQPVYTIGGLNGRNILTFDGTNDHLIHSFNASPAPHSVFVVARRITGGGSYQAIFTAIASGSSFGVNISAKAEGLADWGTYINRWVGGQASLLNNWSAVGIVSPSATSGTEIFDTNGSITTVSYTSRYVGDGFNRRAIGGDPSFGSGYLRGDIAEIVVIMSALSVFNRELMMGYLSWKWNLQANLPANHPFRNRPPLISDI
jgi:hypothetical protein